VNKLSVFLCVDTQHTQQHRPVLIQSHSSKLETLYAVGYKELLEILGDPAHEMRDSGIHTGELPLATANTPAHNANLRPAALADHQWSSTVPLSPVIKMSDTTLVIQAGSREKRV